MASEVSILSGEQNKREEAKLLLSGAGLDFLLSSVSVDDFEFDNKLPSGSSSLMSS